MTAAPRDLRYEIKFVAEPTELHLFEQAIRTHPDGFRVAYPPRQVNNLYFDSHQLSAFDENVSGVSERTKVRFRWYGSAAEAADGALELKCKRNKLGWKQTFKVALLPLRGVRFSDLVRRLRDQLPAEAHAWLDSFGQPAMINRYQRSYYVSQDGRVRITLDRDQQVFDQRNRMTPNLAAAVNLPDVLVIEVKAAASDHAAVSRVVQQIPLRASRHSKYMVGVQASLGVH